MGQSNQVLIFFIRIPEVRNEGEDFGWDPVDWCKAVPLGLNQAEDFECILFKNVELKAENQNA